jgi:hypothetical protein
MEIGTLSELALGLKKPIPRGYAKQIVKEIIITRFKSVKRNPELINTDRWDLSDVFYATRKRLDAGGYDVSPLNDEKTKKRKELYHYVKEYCDKLGIKRHQIGIFAADRAVLYFEGREYSVKFENYKELARLGTDILCVEKEGIAIKLEPFTREFGIALLQSQGFIAEYGEWLAEEAAKTGANVIILTDFDASGIEIAFKLNGVSRLGVDLDTIQWLNDRRGGDTNPVLNIDKLTESSLNNKGQPSSHWDNLKLVLGYDIPELCCSEHNTKYVRYLQKQTHTGERYIDFLKSKRIELNTIENEVGAKRFWEWVKSQLLELFPNRDYNRAITMPIFIRTPIMVEFDKELRSTIIAILRYKFGETREELEYTEGLINTTKKFEGIEFDCQEVLSKDPLIKQIHLGMQSLEKIIADSENDEEGTAP